MPAKDIYILTVLHEVRPYGGRFPFSHHHACGTGGSGGTGGSSRSGNDDFFGKVASFYYYFDFLFVYLINNPYFCIFNSL